MSINLEKVRPVLVLTPRPLYNQILELQLKRRTTTKKNTTLKDIFVVALTEYLEQENKPTSHKREVPNE